MTNEENPVKKAIGYLESLKATLDTPQQARVIKLSELESNSIYEPISDLLLIFQKYKDGTFNIASAQEDLLRMNSIAARLAIFCGNLKANIKHQHNVKKLEYSKIQLAIKDQHQKNLDAGSTVVKLTDNDVKNLAESSLEELYSITHEYECFGDIFQNMFDLVIHFTTILNSITKRNADELRSFNG